MNFEYKIGNSNKKMDELPLETLCKLRDSVVEAINNKREEQKINFSVDIADAIYAANQAGYTVYIDGSVYMDGYTVIELVHEDEEK